MVTEYEHWLAWWWATGRADLLDILLRRWRPFDSADDARQIDIRARYVTRIGMRLRRGASDAEIADLLVRANRELGVRVDERRLAAVAVEIRAWYRSQRGEDH